MRERPGIDEDLLSVVPDLEQLRRRRGADEARVDQARKAHAWHKFSKISAVVHILCKATI